MLMMRIFLAAIVACMLALAAAAQPQTAPQDKAPATPNDPKPPVIPPPQSSDPKMPVIPPPQNDSKMPVIPPPGSPGGNQKVQPK